MQAANMKQYSCPIPAGDVMDALHVPAQVHFVCFCYKVYFVSNFKDFNTAAPAC